MIREYELYHGAALARLASHARVPLSIHRPDAAANSSYIINEKVGIYLKYCTKRLSPWRFTFLREHQDEIQTLRESVPDTFLLLVCYRDGIVVLSYNELKQILDTTHKESEWISVSRTKRRMYTLKGSDGALSCKVGRADFPKKILDCFGPDVHQVDAKQGDAERPAVSC
jgi:hypothetical protein